MKKLLYISALVFCSNTYAECQIMTSSDTELTQAIRLNKGLDLKYYSELCAKLKTANASIAINQETLMTEKQLTVSTGLRLYPIEYEQKYKYQFLTRHVYNLISSNYERTSKSEIALKYASANTALDNLVEDKHSLDLLLDDLAILRNRLQPIN